MDNQTSPEPTTYTFEICQQGSNRYYKCSYPGCGKTCRYKSEIDRHLIRHNDARPFCCTFVGCSKCFKRKDVLDRHYKMHINKSKENEVKVESETQQNSPNTNYNLTFDQQLDLLNFAINMKKQSSTNNVNPSKTHQINASSAEHQVKGSSKQHPIQPYQQQYDSTSLPIYKKRKLQNEFNNFESQTQDYYASANNTENLGSIKSSTSQLNQNFIDEIKIENYLKPNGSDTDALSYSSFENQNNAPEIIGYPQNNAAANATDYTYILSPSHQQ